MQEKISEIIDLLIKEIAQLSEPVHFNYDHVSRKLLKKGYSEPEIHKAVEWVLTNINRKEVSVSIRPTEQRVLPFRMLIEEERNFFSPEAYGYLIQLQSLKMVNVLQVEQIIETCFMLGHTYVELNDMKTVVSEILLGKKIGTLGTDSVYHPGNDKIN